MATEFIQKVLDETRGQERSVSWFRKKIKEFGRSEVNKHEIYIRFSCRPVNTV